MSKNIIKIENKDLVNLKYIISKINVGDIIDYKKIDKLLKDYKSGKISIQEYSSNYEKIVTNAKKTVNNFKNNLTELYICNIISKKKLGKSIELDNDVYFDNIIAGLNIGLKNKVIPKNIFETISNIDTSEIKKNIVNLNCRLKLQNSESLPNKIIVDIANNKMNEITKNKLKK